MDYFKEAEALLYSVPQKEQAIRILEEHKQGLIIKNAPRIPAATDYSKPYTRATFAGDPLNDLCELADTVRRIDETQTELDEIKKAVEAVPTDELKTCLRLWYFERLPKEKIAERLEVWSRSTVYDKRNKAVYEFARIYWGVTAEKMLKKKSNKNRTVFCF